MAVSLRLTGLLLCALFATGAAQDQSTPPSAPISSLVDAQGSPINCTCPATSEFNPVCGTNGATYNSPTKLRCARRCGYDVQLAFYGQCPAPRT